MENKKKDKVFVYVMEREKNICKVGISRFPENRAQAVSNSFGKKVNVVGYFETLDCFNDEKKIHCLLNNYKIGNEFFSISYEQIKCELKGMFHFKDFKPSSLPSLKKITVCLTQDCVNKLNKIFAGRLMENQKTTNYQIIKEAIDLLYLKEKHCGL